MSAALTDQIRIALAGFTGETRLLALAVGNDDEADSAGELMVEAFCATDGVLEIGERDIVALSVNRVLI